MSLESYPESVGASNRIVVFLLVSLTQVKGVPEQKHLPICWTALISVFPRRWPRWTSFSPQRLLVAVGRLLVRGSGQKRRSSLGTCSPLGGSFPGRILWPFPVLAVNCSGEVPPWVQSTLTAGFWTESRSFKHVDACSDGLKVAVSQAEARLQKRKNVRLYTGNHHEASGDKPMEAPTVLSCLTHSVSVLRRFTTRFPHGTCRWGLTGAGM